MIKCFRCVCVLLAFLGIICGFMPSTSAEVPLDDHAWTPEAHYGQILDEDAGAVPTAAQNIARWALEPSSGPKGRPLPLAGSWNTEAWGPAYMRELTEKQHYVLLTFVDPSSRAMYSTLSTGANKARQTELVAKLMTEYYRPGLEYARAHKLPIAIRGWNWGTSAETFQERRITLAKEEIPDTARASAIIEGKLNTRVTDPFGPVKAWQEWGTFWFGNELMRQMQEIYPDPPMVIFLNNNEAGELHSSAGVEKYDRFIAKFGKEPRDRAFMDKVVREGYEERYAAMFAAAKAALVSPTWKKNVRFVAYNTLWGTGYVGNGGPRPGLNFDTEKGWTQWRIYDGSMPELYDNDWQPGKMDNRANGMQIEAMNYYSMQARIFAERPDFLWTTIFWDGSVPSNVWRGRRATSKPYRYAQTGARWDISRYEGWVQFCLWTTRPRLAFEFRGGETLDAVRTGTWMALLNSVDRPWKNPVLAEFWRFGELVPNTAEQPTANSIPDDAPQWVKDLKRWYLLTCDANPARETWEAGTPLTVFAQALVLDKAPKRRWLIYAHAPSGGIADVTVTIPEYGAVKLPSVPRSGAFYLLTEADRSLKTVHAGGPDELTISSVPNPNAASPALGRWYAPGQAVEFKARLALAPGRTITRYVWAFGDGDTLEQATLAQVNHAYKKPGTYLVSLTGFTAKGEALLDQTSVYIGAAPSEAVVYDLPLDDAIAWEGPWEGVGENGQTLAMYRHLPNRGAGQPAILSGGRFVDDLERGRVLEFSNDWDGIWLKRDKQTVITGREGAANRTISFWFKAQDVTKRQMLYASGIEAVGMNIYLDQGQLYAGSWAVVDGAYVVQDPIYGYNWKGDWIKAGPIEPGRWYQVTWVLKDGANKVEPDKQHLFLNGKLVGTAPGASIPVEYLVPRVGRTNMGGDNGPGIGQRALTRFHDQAERDTLKAQDLQKINKLPTFAGRLDDFRFVNAAEMPAQGAAKP